MPLSGLIHPGLSGMASSKCTYWGIANYRSACRLNVCQFQLEVTQLKTSYGLVLAVALLSMSCLTVAQSSTPGTPAEPTEAQMQAMQQQMETMQSQMHQMRNARTPEERQAAMQAHMQTMQGHMQSMQQMGCCQGMGDGHMQGGMMMDGDCMHGKAHE